MVMVSVSNVFASSRMVSNAEVAPVDTVAPEAPSDTLTTGTPIQPQATTEDSIQQETPAETTTDTPVVTEENTQAEQPATVQETPQGEYSRGDNSAAGIYRDRAAGKC